MSSYTLTSPINISSGGAPTQINLFNAAQTFSAQVTAPTTLTTNVTFTLPSTNGSTGQFLRNTGGGSTAWDNFVGTNTYPITTNLYSTNATRMGINTTTYVLFSRIVYVQIAGGNTPSFLRLVYSINGTGSQWQVQLRDVTNSVILGTGTLVSGGGTIVVSQVAVSGFTNGPAVLELYLRRSVGNNRLDTNSWSLIS